MTQAVIPQSALVVLSVGLFFMMLGVALEVKKADWQECLKYPSALIFTIISQLVGIPTLGLIVTFLLPISDVLKLGILMISLCPGGVVSNFFALKAGGNPALSSITTLISSMLVPITLPLGLYLFSKVQPDILVLESTDTLVNISGITVFLIVPALIIGAIFRKWNPSLSKKMLQPLKWFSLVLIGIIIVGTLFKNRAILADEILIVFPMAFLFNALLLAFGYWTSRLFKFSERICRTVSLELGIQNIGIVLFIIPTLFPTLPAVVNIIAFWGVWHLITGLSVSTYWQYKKI